MNERNDKEEGDQKQRNDGLGDTGTGIIAMFWGTIFFLVIGEFIMAAFTGVILVLLILLVFAT